MVPESTYEALDERIKELEEESLRLKQREHALLQSRDIYKTVVDNVDVGLTIIGTDYRIIWVNPIVSKWFKKDTCEFVGKHCYKEFAQKDSVCDYCPFANDIATGRSNEKEIEIIKPDGTHFSLKIRVYPIIKDGKVIALNEILEDITDSKKDEIMLSEAFCRAKQSDYLKSAFLANVSHEIRTPLNPILAYTDLMLDDELSDEHREYLETIKSSGNLLLAIINDILDLSTIEAEQMELKQINVSLETIFKDLDSTYDTIISQKKKNITLRNSFCDNVSKYIISDPKKIQQVLNILMNNAVKFTDSGFIEYGARLRDENRLEFYVRDTGIGIVKDKQEDIFKPFLQADVSHTRKYGGTGLGLTICKRLVELLGGEIKLASNVGEGHGTTFYFTIPYKPIEVETKKTNNVVKLRMLENKTNYTILIVEDDILNQLLAKNILEKSGYSVVISNDGKDAISVYNSDPSIDLILMDIQMPVLDGYQATEVIRAIEKQKEERIPIIALTAYSMKDDRKKCLAVGMDDYITKPIDRNELIAVIEKALH